MAMHNEEDPSLSLWMTNRLHITKEAPALHQGFLMEGIVVFV
jgi:hypothetical protein